MARTSRRNGGPSTSTRSAWLRLRSGSTHAVASASGREGAVQHAYQEAARLADEQGAVMLGLRIAVSETRLTPAFDRPTDALMRLRRLRSLITQDDATADLRMADALLAGSSTRVRPLMAERGK